jgi:microcystin-dependent protein
MSDPYVGEIRMFAGNFAPAGWSFCDGSLLDIADNEALFTLVGTTYGGDGQRNFALPDLRCRAPIHHSGQRPMGNTLNLAPGPATANIQSPPTLAVNYIISLFGIYPSSY